MLWIGRDALECSLLLWRGLFIFLLDDRRERFVSREGRKDSQRYLFFSFLLSGDEYLSENRNPSCFSLSLSPALDDLVPSRNPFTLERSFRATHSKHFLTEKFPSISLRNSGLWFLTSPDDPLWLNYPPSCYFSFPPFDFILITLYNSILIGVCGRAKWRQIQIYYISIIATARWVVG